MDKRGSDHSSIHRENRLTVRELEVLRLMDIGLSNQEIADQLTLSYNTVTWYVRQIFNKLGVNRRGQAVAAARAQGILAETWEVEFQDCVNTLTDREMDVLRLVDVGLSNQAIADQLTLSYNTVTGYVKQIFKKLEVTRRTRAVAAARTLGILDCPKSDTSSCEPQHNLPVQATPFIGRETELAEIGAKLKGGDCQLLALLGPGGSGKTRLAIEAARTQLGDYQDGVFFVYLAPLQEADKIPSAVARALNLSFYGQRESEEQLLDYLQGKEMLLILDNFEHLLAGVGFVNEILRIAPNIKILVTTRTSLTIMGEHIYPVWGMSYPQLSDLVETPASQYGAIKLFESVAGRRQPAFELSDENIPEVIRICALVEGMPLGIILAASWVAMLSPAEIAAEIARDLAFLETEMRDLPPRQRSMQSVFNHSWRLLSEKERQIMAALSVFRGGFTRQAAQKVVGATRHDLMGLTEKTMLHCNPGGRFEVHELLRQYAAEKLAAAGLEGSVRDRHLDYFKQLGEQAEQELVGPDQVVWLDRLEGELDNIRIALGWSSQTDIQSGLQLSSSLQQLWTHSYVLEGDVWLSRLLDRAEQTEPGIRAKALWTQSRINMFYMVNFDRGRALAEKSLALYRELGDQQGVARCLYLLGWVTETKDILLESLAISRAIGDKLGVADVLLGLHDQCDPAQTMAYLNESESIYRELGHLTMIAECLSIIAEVAIGHGDYELARSKLEEYIIIQESTGLRGSITSLTVFGDVYFRLGEYALARTYYERSLAVSLQSGDHFFRNLVEARLGYFFLRMGERAQARSTFLKCQQQSKEGGLIDGVVYSTEGLASLALSQGQAKKAARLFGWADATRQATSDTRPSNQQRPSIQQADIDQDTAIIIERIGEDAYSQAYAEGRSMTMEEAIACSIEGE